MTAERTRTNDLRLEDEALALLEREDEITTDEIEDGDTAGEDSGAGSFLDRFVVPQVRRPR